MQYNVQIQSDTQMKLFYVAGVYLRIREEIWLERAELFWAEPGDMEAVMEGSRDVWYCSYYCGYTLLCKCLLVKLLLRILQEIC